MFSIELRKGYIIDFETHPCHLCFGGDIKFNKLKESIVDNLLQTFIEKKIIVMSLKRLSRISF